MKQQSITFLLILLMSMFGAKALAHDIEVANTDGVTIYYNWINDNTELAVSYRGSHYNSFNNEYSANVVIPESVEYNGSSYSVTSIDYGAFASCSGLTSVTIPSSVTSIGNSAFYYCSGLTSVTIPNSVTSIGNYAFQGCSGLTSVTIPNKVTNIGESAFSGCSSLTSLTIPNSVTSIGQYAFRRCSSLTSLTIPNSVTSIDQYAFSSCSRLTSVNFLCSLTSHGSNIFEYCINIQEVTFDCKIVPSLFRGISSLTKITMTDKVTSISKSAFQDCSSLTSVTIPIKVTNIGNSAFYGCSGLTSVTIPSSVTSIGDNAFANCTSIQYVKTFITEPYSISKNVFPNEVYRQSPLYIPVGTESLYSRFDGWREFLKIEEMDESEQPETPGAEKCATPTISYENGKLSFSCETEDVEFVSDIKSADISKFYSKDVSLTGKYTVTVYATKAGFDNSDTATKEIDISGTGGSGIPGDVNGDGVVNAADVVKVTNIIMGAE